MHSCSIQAHAFYRHSESVEANSLGVGLVPCRRTGLALWMIVLTPVVLSRPQPHITNLVFVNTRSPLIQLGGLEQCESSFVLKETTAPVEH